MKIKILLLTCVFVLFSYAQERPLYEAHFNADQPSIFLPVEIDGQECSFLFDTGASFVVLDKSYQHLLGKPLGIKEAEARSGIRFDGKYIQTPNGRIKLELFKALPLKLGKLQVANRFPYLVADLQSLWPFSGEKFCGILGTSFLHQFRWEINFEKSIIKAFIGAEPYMGSFSSRSQIFWSKGRIPQVAVSFEGREIAFDVDTGDNGGGRIQKENLIFLKHHSQVLASQKQDYITVSSLSVGREYRLRSLEFANVKYPKVVLHESLQNALGLNFLKRHNIIFDFPFNMMYMIHHKDYAKVQELDKSGLRIILKDNKFIVFNIKRTKGATLEGIQEGDEIVSVEGITNLTLFKLRTIFKEEEGTEFVLKVKRKNELSSAFVRLGEDPL